MSDEKISCFTDEPCPWRKSRTLMRRGQSISQNVWPCFYYLRAMVAWKQAAGVAFAYLHNSPPPEALAFELGTPAYDLKLRDGNDDGCASPWRLSSSKRGNTRFSKMQMIFATAHARTIDR
jgi:hypothetical protein